MTAVVTKAWVIAKLVKVELGAKSASLIVQRDVVGAVIGELANAKLV